jgi:hypothetical protein
LWNRHYYWKNVLHCQNKMRYDMILNVGWCSVLQRLQWCYWLQKYNLVSEQMENEIGYWIIGTTRWNKNYDEGLFSMEIGEFKTYLCDLGEKFLVSEITWDMREWYVEVKQGAQNMSNKVAGLMNRLDNVIWLYPGSNISMEDLITTVGTVIEKTDDFLFSGLKWQRQNGYNI